MFVTTYIIEKAMSTTEKVIIRKDLHVESMTNDEILNELKERNLPTFGTAQEKKDRLKKYLGKTTAFH
jgi:hypothetical protein